MCFPVYCVNADFKKIREEALKKAKEEKVEATVIKGVPSVAVIEEEQLRIKNK